MRGQLTPEIQDTAKAFFGRGISTPELGMMPYLCYVMQNSRKLDPAKMNKADRDVWATWKKDGHVDGGMTGVVLTAEFWRAIHDIILLAYVAHD